MLPINVQFGVQTPDTVASTSHSYIQKLQRRLDWAYEIADKVPHTGEEEAEAYGSPHSNSRGEEV